MLELHSELAEAYDRLGRVEDALRHADELAEQGYACAPDPRCRRAEILTRHGRLEEAAAIWDAVAQDTPGDVWVYNNAGLEYGAVGEHEAALSWLTRGVELALRTGDPEGLLGQLRDLRAASLAALGRDQDDLQTAEPVTPSRPAGKTARLVEQVRQMAGERREPTGTMPLAVAWLPADEYPDWPARWPDLADATWCWTRSMAASSPMPPTANGWSGGCASCDRGRGHSTADRAPASCGAHAVGR